MRRRKKTRKKEKKPDFKGRVGSFSFFIAIPALFVVGLLCLVTLIGYFHHYSVPTEIISLFACGFVSLFTIVSGMSVPRFRTFIHELKHAVVVILTGNRVTDFKVEKHTGHVSYKLFKDKLHFAPLIMLAPYCYPLFSLPVFIACLVFENHYRLPLTFTIGATLAMDLTTGYKELHPHQSDLKRVFGGFLIAGSYIAATTFAWSAICLLWVVGGRNAFIIAGYNALYIGEIILQNLLKAS